MLFNRETDTGDHITGYVVPDGYSSVPRIRVVSGGDTLLVMEANEDRPALVESQRHETGRCGFSIDATLIADLASRTDLEIRDEDSGLLIYRRPRPTDANRKVLRVETSLFPLWRLDKALAPPFQYSLIGAENHGRETVMQLFHLYEIGSVYLSGRILYRNYADLIEGRYEVFTVIRDPFEQMAERLLVLSKIKNPQNQYISSRDLSYYESTIAFAQTLTYTNLKVLKRCLGQMPAEVAVTLANPLVRQLTTTAPTDMPEGGAIAAALDALSMFALVGLQSDAAGFIRGVEELLQVAPGSLPPLPVFGAVHKLADMLRESKMVDGLIEKDQELYYYLNESFKKINQTIDERSPVA